jgi:hypothetical protein
MRQSRGERRTDKTLHPALALALFTPAKPHDEFLACNTQEPKNSIFRNNKKLME